MKFLIFSLILKFSFASLAAGYEIKFQGNKSVLMYEGKNIEIPLQAQAARLIEVKALDKNHDLIIYESEQAGTKQIIQINRAIVIQKKGPLLLTKDPLDYQFIDVETKKVEEQATFQVNKNQLHWNIEDEKKVISLESPSH